MKNTNYTIGTITKCRINEEIKLLNLKDFDRSCMIISFLYKLGVNVISNNYFKYDSDHNKVYFNMLLEESNKLYFGDHKDIINAGGEIDKFFFYSFYLCQLLTDFENGLYFKEELTRLGYEGYIFNESKDGNTCCIFSSDKFDSPIHEII